MSQRYFVHDIKSRRVRIFAESRDDWLSLPDDLRGAVKRACIWNGRFKCWVTRRQGDKGQVLESSRLPAAWLTDNGFSDLGESDRT